MLTRKAGAALAAGCTCVIKPSEDTPLTTLLAVKLSLEAGFPPGVINVVTCGKENTPEVGRHLCEHENVRGLSFTGNIYHNYYIAIINKIKKKKFINSHCIARIFLKIVLHFIQIV